MKIVTCITNPDQIGYKHALKASCEYFGLELITLMIENYVSHRQKTIHLKEYLQTIDPAELIFFTDGYDTIFVAGEEEILEKYHRLSPNGKILMSADRFCVPDNSMAVHFKSTSFGFNYICSGGFIGSAGVILQSIKSIEEVMKGDNSNKNKEYFWCDQYEWTQAIINKKIDIILDHNCEIFQTLTSPKSAKNLFDFLNTEPALVENEDLSQRVSVMNTIKDVLDDVEITKDCRVFNKHTKTKPIQIHFNNKINKLIMFMEPFVQLIDKFN
jgi:hypothetical protein